MLPTDEIVRMIIELEAKSATNTLEALQDRVAILSSKLRELSTSSGASLNLSVEYLKAAVSQYNSLLPVEQKVTISAVEYKDALSLAVLANKNNVTSSRELLRLQQQVADAAKRSSDSMMQPVKILGKTFTAEQFAPVLQQFQQLSKLNFSNVSKYGQNVQQLMGNIRTLSQQTGASFQDVGKYIQQTFNIQRAPINDAIKNLNTQLKGATVSADGLNQVLRLIRGTLVAVGVFRVISFLDESMRKAIETAKDFETSLYRIANVERILSQGGIETSAEGLRNIIQKLKKDLPIFSEADITQQVSLIGIMTKEFGLTEEKIYDVAKAIGVLNIRSGENEDLLATTNKVLTAMVAPSGRGIASLGLDFSQAAIEAMALENSVLAAGESFKDLTDHDKDMLKIAILLKSTGEEFKTIQDFLETNTGQLAEQSAEWEDLLRIAGQYFLTVKSQLAPILTEIIKRLQDAFNMGKALLGIWVGIRQAVVGGLATYVESLKAIFSGGNILENIKNFWKNIGDASATGLKDGLRTGFQQLFSGVVPENAPEWFKNIFGDFVEDSDTATGKVKEFKDAISSLEDLDDFKDLIEDISDLQQKLADTEFEFQLGKDRDLEDFNTKMERLAQDYAIKRERVVLDANQAIEDANRKHRTREKDDEAKFQEQMRQLREKFLFDLEDALRERDARQVLRLQRQFQMDKTALENENALRKTQQDEQHAEDIARIIRERDERLAELAQEEQIKAERERADFELEQKRKEEDHLRDMERLRQQLSERLMEYAEAFGEEYDLNDEAVKRLYQLLESYYGQNGKFDQLYNYSTGSILAQSQYILDTMNAMIAQAALLSASMPSFMAPTVSQSAALKNVEPYYTSNIMEKVGRQASGGMFLASQPTTATFGERGPELATFIPLRSSMPAMNLGSAMGGGQGVGGSISLRVDLSPDLEARIVDKSLDNVSAVINTVRRER